MKTLIVTAGPQGRRIPIGVQPCLEGGDPGEVVPVGSGRKGGAPVERKTAADPCLENGAVRRAGARAQADPGLETGQDRAAPSSPLCTGRGLDDARRAGLQGQPGWGESQFLLGIFHVKGSLES